MTATVLLQEALKLPPEEREDLCVKLQESLRSPDTASGMQDETLVRRMEAHRQAPQNVITRDALEKKWLQKWGWKP